MLKIAPASFIRDRRLTCWHSVPSVIVLLHRLGKLTPGAFPDLRLSRFAGEALPEDAARAWRVAAPNSEIENLYGPTECAIIVTGHRWREGDEQRKGIVPIGKPLSSVESLLASEDDYSDSGAATGELLIGGDQVTGRYLDSDEQTVRAFVRVPGRGEGLWYRTGDLVERDDKGLLFYLGRIDEQVQVQGNRVELLEVDAALRTVTGAPVAMAVPWPPDAGRVETLYAAVPAECSMETGAIRRGVARLLPAYMVPERVVRVDTFPVNTSGKYDRSALARKIEQERA
jgi:acyl-coenzyme A synthetase/AMP-(fatty) acid ligase